MSDLDTPRLTAEQLLPLAVAAKKVDVGLMPAGSIVGSCPTCDTPVREGDGEDDPITLGVIWTARPCGCRFRLSLEALDEVFDHLESIGLAESS